MSDKVYPDWVQKQKTRGTTVKKVGNNYYLYKHSSKRVPGKKYPVPVDSYIGKITPEGIEKSCSKKVDVNEADVTVKEYGFSRSVELLCPAGWKEPLGKEWQEVLDLIIVRESPDTDTKGPGGFGTPCPARRPKNRAPKKDEERAWCRAEGPQAAGRDLSCRDRRKTLSFENVRGAETAFGEVRSETGGVTRLFSTPVR